jgi:hypothetical protein
MEVCYWALLFMPLVILHHLLNVFVQLANKRGLTKKKKKKKNVTDKYGFLTISFGTFLIVRYDRGSPSLRTGAAELDQNLKL